MADKSSSSDTSTQTTAADSAAVSVPQKKKSNKTLWIVLSLVLFFFVVVPVIVVGAGAIWLNKNATSDKLTENVTENLISKATGGKVDVDTKNGSVNLESGGSSIGIGGDQKLPDDFPKDKIPYIKEKSVSFSYSSASEGKKTWSVSTLVDQNYDTAKAFFAGKITDADYTDVTSYSFGNSQTLYGIKAPYSVSVTVTQNEDDTKTSNVTYLVSEQ